MSKPGTKIQVKLECRPCRPKSWLNQRLMNTRQKNATTRVIDVRQSSFDLGINEHAELVKQVQDTRDN